MFAGKSTLTLVLIGIGALVSLFVCVGLSIFTYGNAIWNEGLAKERTLSSQYLDNQNELSAFVSGFYEQVGIVQAAGDQLDQILLDAVKGRYDEQGYGSGSPLFTAITEAYPEAGVDQLMENWGKIQDHIAAGREAYKSKQSKLLDMLREYDTWRQTGLLRRFIVSFLGFPSDNLEARLADNVETGEEARDLMYRIVLASDAIKAYETGVMDPLKVPNE